MGSAVTKSYVVEWGTQIGSYIDGSETKVGDVVVHKDVRYIVLGEDEDKRLSLVKSKTVYVDLAVSQLVGLELKVGCKPSIHVNRADVSVFVKCPESQVKLTDDSYGRWLIANKGSIEPVTE